MEKTIPFRAHVADMLRWILGFGFRRAQYPLWAGQKNQLTTPV
jgi:hypothetical protein